MAKVVPFLLAFTKFKIDAFDDLHHQRMSKAEEKAKATHTLTIFFSVMITKEEAAAVLSIIFKGRSILKKGHFFSKVGKPSPKPIQTFFLNVK